MNMNLERTTDLNGASSFCGLIKAPWCVSMNKKVDHLAFFNYQKRKGVFNKIYTSLKSTNSFPKQLRNYCCKFQPSKLL